MEKFNGKIWCESNENKGSNFYFEIPYISSNENKIVNEKNAKPKNGDRINLKGKVIIVAEDEDSTYYYIEKVLRNTEADVFWAKNGKESVDLVDQIKNIDLILMDIQMPEMDGYEATTKIKAINQNIPVIAQTAYAFNHHKDEILNFGFDDFIPKPYKSNELLQKIKKHLKL